MQSRKPLERAVPITLDDEDQPLSTQIMGYWTRFATSGDPNGAGAETWPSYQTSSDQHLELDLPLGSGSGLRAAKCDFWDSPW